MRRSMLKRVSRKLRNKHKVPNGYVLEEIIRWDFPSLRARSKTSQDQTPSLGLGIVASVGGSKLDPSLGVSAMHVSDKMRSLGGQLKRGCMSFYSPMRLPAVDWISATNLRC